MAGTKNTVIMSFSIAMFLLLILLLVITSLSLFKMPYKSRKRRSTKKCSNGRKGVRSHKRKSGKTVKSYCRRSNKKSVRRSYKKSRQTSRCGPGKRYVKSFRRSDGSTSGGFCASLTRRRRSTKKSNKSYKPRKYNKSRKQKSSGSLFSGLYKPKSYKPRTSMNQPKLYEPSLFSQQESRSPTPFRNPFVQRSPSPVKASSFRPQELPKEEELGMDFKPLTERMRYRISPKQGIFGSLKAGLDKGKQFAAKAQAQVSSAIQKGQELTKKAEQLQQQAAKKAEEFQKAAEKIQSQAEQAHAQYTEAKKQLTDIVGSTGLPVVSPGEVAKETAQQVASTVQPAMRMRKRYY